MTDNNDLPTDPEGDEPTDPFDPRAFRAPPGDDDLAIRATHTSIPVKRVGNAGWFRAQTDPAYVVDYYVVTADKGTTNAVDYIVSPALVPHLGSDASKVRLLACADKTGHPFLLRLTVPRPGLPANSWLESGLEVTAAAQEGWVRGRSNQGLRSYDLMQAPDQTTEPKFPDESMDELVKLAFKDRFIIDFDHEVLRELRGEA